MQKLNAFFTLIIVLISVSISCVDKLSDEEEFEMPLLAGVAQQQGFHKIFSPPILVRQSESGCLEYSGSDSIDIESDGVYDLAFHPIYHAPDFNGICCIPPDDPDVIGDCWPVEYYSRYI